MNQAEMNRAEIGLSEAANGIDDALRILRKLAEHDSTDKVYQQAIDALKDAGEHLEDAIESVADGIGLGDDDA